MEYLGPENRTHSTGTKGLIFPQGKGCAGLGRMANHRSLWRLRRRVHREAMRTQDRRPRTSLKHMEE